MYVYRYMIHQSTNIYVCECIYITMIQKTKPIFFQLAREISAVDSNYHGMDHSITKLSRVTLVDPAVTDSRQNNITIAPRCHEIVFSFPNRTPD